MPRLQEYTPQVQAPGPVDVHATSADFGGAAAQGLGQLGAGLSDTGQFLEKREASADVAEQHAKVSQIRNQSIVDLHEAIRTADPNDKDFVDNFMNGVNQKLQSLQDGAQTPAGRNFLQRSTEAVSGELLRTAAIGRQELAGQAAVEQHGAALVANTNSVRLAPDQYDSILAQNNAALQYQVQHGGMDSKLALKLQNDDTQALAVATVQGTMQNGKNGPQAARDLLDSGKFTNILDSDQHNALYHAADRQDSLNIEMDNAAQRQKDVVLKQQQTQTMSDFIDKIAGHTLTDKDVLNSNLPPVGEGSKEHFLQKIAVMNTEAEKDNSMLSPLVKSVLLPNGAPGKIYDQSEVVKYIGKGITPNGAKEIFSFMEGKGTPDGDIRNQLWKKVLDSAHGELDKSTMGFKDPQGPDRERLFLERVLPLRQQWEKQGKTPTEIAELAAKEIPTFKATLPDIMNSMRQQNTPGQAPNPVEALRSKALPPPAPGKIRVVDPNGQPGDVDASRLDEFIGKGYRRAQ